MSILSAQTIRDLCLRHDPPLLRPFVEKGSVNGKSYGLSACSYDVRIDQPIRLASGKSALASTMEEFYLPNNVCASVLDKSTYARLFVSAFNTHLDPGWSGYLTVELANLGPAEVVFEAGEPLCQIKFEFLDMPTELPYRGKYMNQPRGPQGARFA